MATKRKFVVVRTYSAGVHVGELVERNGKEVVLKDARRLWFWMGAFTLNAVATAGVGPGTQISAPVSEVVVTEAIEVLTCSPGGEKSLREFKSYEP